METKPTTTAGIVAGQVPRVSPNVAAWAEARRISAETLGLLGVGSGMTSFREAGHAEAAFFRFREGWKARAIKSKDFVAGGGFKLSFWNLDRVLGSQLKQVFITEGEMDACALVEAGIPPDQVLSVPNGAKLKPTENPEEAKGYDYVNEALEAGLRKAGKVIWCGDGDGPGLALRADMAQLFGSAKFWFVEWPDGIKDANDFLVAKGPEELMDFVVDSAKEWPVAGLYRLEQLPEPAPLTLWEPGFPEWESKIRLAPRTLSVVTGHPGHGKTAFWTQVWFQVVKQYGVSACVATFETRPKPHIRRQIRTLLMRKLEKEMTAEEMKLADEWINERYLFVVHPEQRPTLDWFLDMAEVAVIRHGVRIIQLDPWNRLEASRGRDESETEYIGRCLRGLHAFAHDMNCHVQILAHPAKMDSARRGQAPGLEDISGSKNWENMVDQGFVVHRPEIFDGSTRKTAVNVYQRKARFEELGFPCKLALDYKVAEGRYVSTDYAGY